jgi:uncharacterized membrane protein
MFAGAMLNIGLTLGAYWRGLSPGAFLEWFSEHSHLIRRTIAIFVMPTVIGLVASLWLGWSQPTARYLWLSALLCIVVLGLITFAFHVPTNATFAAKTVALEQVPAKLDQRLWLHWVRIALGLASAVLGMVASSR